MDRSSLAWGIRPRDLTRFWAWGRNARTTVVVLFFMMGVDIMHMQRRKGSVFNFEVARFGDCLISGDLEELLQRAVA